MEKELIQKQMKLYPKNEYMTNKDKKCQIISFRMSMKKSISENKSNELKNNNIIYNKKIITKIKKLVK
jgi:hypothetical protein